MWWHICVSFPQGVLGGIWGWSELVSTKTKRPQCVEKYCFIVITLYQHWFNVDSTMYDNLKGIHYVSQISSYIWYLYHIVLFIYAALIFIYHNRISSVLNVYFALVYRILPSPRQDLQRHYLCCHHYKSALKCSYMIPMTLCIPHYTDYIKAWFVMLKSQWAYP